MYSKSGGLLTYDHRKNSNGRILFNLVGVCVLLSASLRIRLLPLDRARDTHRQESITGQSSRHRGFMCVRRARNTASSRRPLRLMHARIKPRSRKASLPSTCSRRSHSFFIAFHWSTTSSICSPLTPAVARRRQERSSTSVREQRREELRLSG